jgi:CDGSH-type Zn-finger protein
MDESLFILGTLLCITRSLDQCACGLSLYVSKPYPDPSMMHDNDDGNKKNNSKMYFYQINYSSPK